MLMIYQLILSLSLSHCGKMRERLAGEVIPVSAEHTGNKASSENNIAAYAIDLDLDTKSVATSSAGLKWLKIQLDRIYCIDKVVRFQQGGSAGTTWTCSETDCSSCEGKSCESNMKLTTFFEGEEPAGLSHDPDCKHGDTVKLEKSDGGQITTWEIGVFERTEPCPAGTYQPADQTVCIACDQGTISEEGAVVCTLCDLGEASNEERTECVECAKGTYRDNTVEICTECPENTVTEQEGSETCSPCPAGYISNSDGSSCEVCATGTYRSDGATKCEPVSEVLDVDDARKYLNMGTYFTLFTN